MKIYKYKLDNIVELPSGAKILTVLAKTDGVFVYAQIPPNTDGTTQTHKLMIVPTGAEFECTDGAMNYINSVVVDNYYVFHIYEVI